MSTSAGDVVGGPLSVHDTAMVGLYRREDLVFLFLVLAYVAGSYAAAWSMGRAEHVSFFMYSAAVFLGTLLIFGLLFIAYRATWLMFVVHPQRLTVTLVRDIRDTFLSRERLLRALPVILLLIVFMSVFTSMKNLVPLFHPYDWDGRLHALDVWLHGGVEPWRLLQAALGHPVITFAINIAYNIWLFVVCLILYWQAFAMRDPLLRMQFFCSFVLTWAINGTVFAVAFSSVGPCFYGQFVGGDSPYQPLMQYLNEVNRHYPVWALTAQEYLWDAYQQNSLRVGSGISAMPSVHVASVVIFALLGWRVGRLPGWVLTGFALVVFLGSVHLGWHYAIDGYFSFITSLLIWKTAGWLLQQCAGKVSDSRAFA